MATAHRERRTDRHRPPCPPAGWAAPDPGGVSRATASHRPRAPEIPGGGHPARWQPSNWFPSMRPARGPDSGGLGDARRSGGLADSERNIFEQVLDDITVNHPDTPAYYVSFRYKCVSAGNSPRPTVVPAADRFSDVSFTSRLLRLVATGERPSSDLTSGSVRAGPPSTRLRVACARRSSKISPSPERHPQTCSSRPYASQTASS